jgi:hypothetical protein
MPNVLRWFRTRFVPAASDRPQRPMRKPTLRTRRMLAFLSPVVAVLATAALPSPAMGAGWRIQTTVNPTGATRVGLAGVSCISETSCVAVGQGSGAGGSEVLAEGWNGTAWSDQPVEASGSSPSLTAVSCVSATFCVAVGGTGGLGSPSSTLAEMWNGATWKVLPSPSPRRKSSSVLSGVSCVTASFCAAAGQWNNGTAAGTILELWNGARWKLQTTPTAGNAGVAYLRAISCVAANACTAVGSYSVKAQPFPVDHGLVERWNGRRWLLQHAPNLRWGPDLAGVSCASRSSCIAVGAQTPGQSSFLQAAAERWDGARWVPATTGLPPILSTTALTQFVLSAVSCVSATMCTAVGHFYVGGYRTSKVQQVVELWNGRRWGAEATQHAPNGSEFYSVACVLRTGCTAVGSSWQQLTFSESDFPSTPTAIS